MVDLALFYAYCGVKAAREIEQHMKEREAMFWQLLQDYVSMVDGRSCRAKRQLTLTRKMDDSWEDIVSAPLFERDILCKQLTRVTYDTLEYIVGIVVASGEAAGRSREDVARMCGCALYYLGRGCSFEDAGCKFKVSSSTAKRYLSVVVDALSAVTVVDSHIHLPRSPEEWDRLERGFESLCGMHGVVGAVDCTHILVNRDEARPLSYINRANHSTIVLQATADYSARFMNISCGWMGSKNDQGIWNNSWIGNFLLPQRHRRG